MPDERGIRWNGIGTLFRFITPILVTIALFILNQLRDELKRLTEMVYEHQTNAEIHIPRGEFERIRSEILEMRHEVLETIRSQRR